jgi:hypothetical protein
MFLELVSEEIINKQKIIICLKNSAVAIIFITTTNSQLSKKYQKQ